MSVVAGMRSDIKAWICTFKMRVEEHWHRFTLGSCGAAVTGGQKLDKHLPEKTELTLPEVG